MTVEALIEGRLPLYYVLLLLSLGFSIFFNLDKKERINQAGLAKVYSVISIIFLVLFILNYSISDTLKNLQPTSSRNLGYLIFIFVLNDIGILLEVFSYVYPVIAIGFLAVGIIRKVVLYLGDNTKKPKEKVTFGIP